MGRLFWIIRWAHLITWVLKSKEPYSAVVPGRPDDRIIERISVNGFEDRQGG